MNILFALAGVVIMELYRRKDFYVLFVMTALITLLMGSINFFDDNNISRYLKEICLLLIWVSSLVIAITTAARQIPAERESRTIFPLLAKPVTRAHLIGGKFLGCWLASGLVLLVFYVFFLIISGTREHAWPLALYAKAFWMHWVCLAVVIAGAVFCSVVLAAPSSTNTIWFICVCGILLVGAHLGKVALQMHEPGRTLLYVAYYAMPHLEWYDIRDLLIHDRNAADWIYIGGATLYGAVYTLFFLMAAWLVFRRKSLA